MGERSLHPPKAGGGKGERSLRAGSAVAPQTAAVGTSPPPSDLTVGGLPPPFRAVGEMMLSNGERALHALRGRGGKGGREHQVKRGRVSGTSRASWLGSPHPPLRPTGRRYSLRKRRESWGVRPPCKSSRYRPGMPRASGGWTVGLRPCRRGRSGRSGARSLDRRLIEPCWHSVPRRRQWFLPC